MSNAKKKIKILVVDDHPVVRKGLCSCLASRAHLKVVGEAADGEEAIRKVAELAPDLVLIALGLTLVTAVAGTLRVPAEGS